MRLHASGRGLSEQDRVRAPRLGERQRAGAGDADILRSRPRVFGELAA